METYGYKFLIFALSLFLNMHERPGGMENDYYGYYNVQGRSGAKDLLGRQGSKRLQLQQHVRVRGGELELELDELGELDNQNGEEAQNVSTYEQDQGQGHERGQDFRHGEELKNTEVITRRTGKQSYIISNVLSYHSCLNRFVDLIVFPRTKQDSKIFTCDICFFCLSVSSILASSNSTHACLRRSFREECLNIIEIYTKSEKLSKLNHEIYYTDVNLGVNVEITCFEEEITSTSTSTSLTVLFIFDQTIIYRLYRISNSSPLRTVLNLNLIFFVLTFQLNFLNKMLLALCGDVELNPGPDKITLMTQNCRGLQDYNKLRLLIKGTRAILNKEKAVLALQETHLMNDDMIKWSGNYVISCSASPHSAGCVTYLNDYVRIIETRQIDNNGHGHVIVVEGLTTHTAILANIYSPVRSMVREQDEFYNKLLEIVEELEGKYLFSEPNLIILGDFNLPLEPNATHHSNEVESRRAGELAARLEQKGLTDCWKINDERFTYKTARSRLDRIMYRLDFDLTEKLETEWTFINSDHCLLRMTLSPARIDHSRNRVVSLPTYLLENEELLQMMKIKMAEMVNDAIDHWEPRVRLE